MKELHQKFLTNVQKVECSYAQFCCNVPKEIIKPKPEDWGTCLCMPRLNPELKLEAIKRKLGDIHNLTIESLKDKQFEEDIKDLCHQIENSDTAFKYLGWSKEKGQNVQASSHFFKKMPVPALGKNFLKNSKNILNHWLTMHPDSSHNIKELLRLNNSFKIHQGRVSCCILIGLKMLIFTRPVKKNRYIIHQHLLVSTQLFYIRVMELKVYVQ